MQNLSKIRQKWTIQIRNYVYSTKNIKKLTNILLLDRNWLQRLEAIARYFAFEKGAYCPNLRLEERLANKTDEWVM